MRSQIVAISEPVASISGQVPQIKIKVGKITEQILSISVSVERVIEQVFDFSVSVDSITGGISNIAGGNVEIIFSDDFSRDKTLSRKYKIDCSFDRMDFSQNRKDFSNSGNEFIYGKIVLLLCRNRNRQD